MARSLLGFALCCALSCKTPENLVWIETRCPAGQVASSGGDCIPPGTCADRRDCDDDERCDDHACVPDVLPDTCTDDEACEEGRICSVDGACIDEGTCAEPEDCRVAGEVCTRRLVCLPEGRCEEDGDCAEGRVCDDTVCIPGGDCGETRFDLDVPPNLMLLLDRSSSMDEDLDGRTKWEVAVEAVAGTIGAWDDRIRFGLALFSNCEAGGECAPGAVVTPCSPNTAAAINDTLSVTARCRTTPLGASLFALVGEPSLADAARDNAILLISDGADTCTGDPPGGAAALLGQAIPVATYVVGFGAGVDAAQLTAVATAAGTARGDPAYYQADDAAGLSAALDQVAGRVLGCVHPLTETPPDPELVYVFFDGSEELDRDANDGWTYDAATNTVTFHGAACDRIEAGDVSDIDVFFGCPDDVG